MCIKWQVLEDGIEKGQKVNFPLRFEYVNFKIFSENFNLQWLLAQTRKNLALGFLIPFRIIKDFRQPIKYTLMFIKIRILIKEILSEFMQIFKKFEVSIDFFE